MTQVGWRFPPLSGGTRQGYTNNDIEVFKGQELIDNLAREICQNSLDARIEGTDTPVRVVFELRQISRSGYDVFSQYSRCLKGCRKYWGTEMDAKLCRFVEGAEATLTENNIPVLIASDYNTKGLSGSHNGKLSSSWEALTGSDGVSVKSDENSAGSYGIGKNAPFACSSLSMVFYNTVAENNESAFIGVARLATLLNEDGKPTQRVGKYQNNDEENEKWFPIYDTDENDFRDCFHRIERGTDVIIVGFTQTTNWLTNVTKAVLKNFFVAISEGRLVVELKNGNDIRIIDESTLSQLFADFSDDTEMLAASQLYKAFTSPDYKQIESSDRKKRKLARESIQKIDDFVLNLLKSQFEVVTEDTVDAAGVGEYIPDDIDGLGGQAEGDDILKVKIKIGKIKTNHVHQGYTTEVAVQEEGTEAEGDVHNHEHNPNPVPPRPHPPKPVTPDPDDPDPQHGATPGKGVKTVNTPNLSAQRAFPVSSSQGLYKIVIKPAEKYENLYVECFAVGEDSKTDSLDMESFTFNSKNIKISNGKAGPIKVEADTPAVFFVKFLRKEKMKLRLSLTEVVKK